MSNGMTIPPQPSGFRSKFPVKCTLCGVVWDRLQSPVPSCQHTPQEWEDFYATRSGLPQDQQRQMWLPVQTAEEAKARAEIRAARRAATPPRVKLP